MRSEELTLRALRRLLLHYYILYTFSTSLQRLAFQKICVTKGGNGAPVKNSREVREEMEGGNAVSEANGITQFANGEPKRWDNPKSLILPVKTSRGDAEPRRMFAKF